MGSEMCIRDSTHTHTHKQTHTHTHNRRPHALLSLTLHHARAHSLTSPPASCSLKTQADIASTLAKIQKTEGDQAAALAAGAERSDQSETQPPAQANPPPIGESAADVDGDGVEVRCTSFIFPFTNPALHLVRFPSLTPCPVQILTADQFFKMKQQQEKDRKLYASVIVAAQNSAAKRRSQAPDKGPSKRQKKSEPADSPDKAALKKAVLYFSAASKLAALTTEELEQFLAINKPV